MKKILCMLVLILTVVCVVASCDKGDAPEITISEDGYWVINGEKTDVKAQGEKGDKGDSASTTNENPLGLAFFLKDDDTYVVEIGYAKYLSKIEIPATYNGKAVTEVRNFTSETLKEVTIPDNVTSIGNSAFAGCSALTSVTIPDSVTSIGTSAFYRCDALTSITIPDSVTSIGTSAFGACRALTSVTIPDSVTSIGDGAFSGCDNLVVDEYDDAYYFGNDQNPYLILLRAKSTDITSCTVHQETQFIHSYAFSDCDSLTSIIIPDSVTSIGSCAFSLCDSLTSVTIGDNVTSIGKDAFMYCSALTSVTVPDSVTSIGSCAFRSCDALTSVIFVNPNGWWCANSADATSGTDLSADDLADSVTATQYLKSIYNSYYWFRTE